MKIYDSIQDARTAGKKQLSILIDPDKISLKQIERLAALEDTGRPDYFFVGGSLLVNNQLEECVKVLKQYSKVPVVLFPGSTLQMSWKADAILFLSLISGRNAEMLIGRHVIAAPYLKLSPLEVISCGYMLIESGKATAVQYMSNTMPIPSEKLDIAICTAMAGEMLGLKLIYLEAGSGAMKPVPVEMVQQVKENIQIPLITGGGIRTPEQAIQLCQAGADLLVVGSAIEGDYALAGELCSAVHQA